MNIGIYIEPFGGLGGAESCVAVLAEALSLSHKVEIIHHNKTLARDQLAQHSGTDLSAVQLRYFAHEPHMDGLLRNPWQRYRASVNWHAGLSKPYDLFINFTHAAPPYCHAAKGILVVLFPHPRTLGRLLHDSPTLQERLRHYYYAWQWKGRMATYEAKVAISQFTQVWSNAWWEIDCSVIYPPVDTHFDSADKANIILSVGRFAAQGVSKRQLEMVTTFKRVGKYSAMNWEYFCIGNLGDAPDEKRYFENVRRAVEGDRIQVLTNMERAKLKLLYEEAKIFWHAAGYGEDCDMHPGQAEHFGIVTVEAMAAGCVPVVINKGGQVEIVEHGVSGFVWETLEELKEYTTLLMQNEKLRMQMSEQARTRASLFSRENFVNRFVNLLNFDS